MATMLRSKQPRADPWNHFSALQHSRATPECAKATVYEQEYATTGRPHVTTIYVGHATHKGMVRSDNQDALGKFPEGSLDLSLPKGQLFIVADGIGGQKAGERASKLAVQIIAEHYFSTNEKDLLTNLKRAFDEANSHIYEQGTSDHIFTGMGTTCTSMVLQNNRAIIGHIGDSRIYLITVSSIVQLTADHSRVADLVRKGILTKDQALSHPGRSQLYRALGTRPTAEVDFIEDIELPEDCYFLMCTDGLFNHVNEDEMQALVLANPPGKACEALVNLANERGGRDNITVQVIHAVS